MADEKTLEELQAELAALERANTERKIAFQKAALEDAQKKEEEEKLTAMKATWEEEYKKKIIDEGWTPKVEGDEVTGEPSGDRPNEELHENIAFAQELATTWQLPGLADYETMATGYQKQDAVAFTNYPVNCPLTTRDEWEAECFADVMWEAVICKSNFLGKNITVKGLDFTAGCGGVVQLRYINHATPSKDFEAMSPCKCMTCVSNTLATYTLTMEQYGDYHVICDVDAFTVGSALKEMVMRSMATRASERIDDKIDSILYAASPTYTATLDTDCAGAKTYGRDTNCCDFGTNLFEKIMDLEAEMRNAGYFDTRDPVLIINPNVAVHLKYRSGLSTPMYWYNNIEMEGTKIAKIGNIEVIEACHATDCSATPGIPVAYLIDPARAIGEAWGKRPSFKTDEDPIECEQLKIVLTMWADFAVLDAGAVGHILNGT